MTLTAAEEDVTLYYSYDGTEWVLYAGPFAPTATPVYAMAVDRAGNESAVSRLAVQVTASQPVQTGDAAPRGGVHRPAAADGAGGCPGGGSCPAAQTGEISPYASFL